MRIFLIVMMFLVAVSCGGKESYAAEKMIEGQVPDERPLTPDYSKLYYLGYNKETSSSPCIGNPVTAECAVDTYEACLHWWDVKLCGRTNFKIPDGYKHYRPNKHTMIIYKFLSKRLITDADIPEHYRDTWRVGDTVIFTSGQVCTRYEHCYTALEDRSDPRGKCLPLDCDDAGSIIPETGKHPTDIYILRQNAEKKWFVVTMLRSYYIPTDPDRPEKLYQEGLAQSPW